MNITGEKVRIRDRVPADSVMEIVWSRDLEVAGLDPSAGGTPSYQPFSIETLGGEHIGTCSLYGWTSEEVQLGIRIGNKDYWNKGYGTEVTNMLTDYALSTGVKRVWLKVLPQNIRAIRCYEKCGFIHYGRLLLNGYDFTIMERKQDG